MLDSGFSKEVAQSGGGRRPAYIGECTGKTDHDNSDKTESEGDTDRGRAIKPNMGNAGNELNTMTD